MVGAGFADAPIPLAEMTVEDGRLGTIVRANRAWANLIDTHPDALAGSGLGQLLHPADSDLVDLPIEAISNPTMPRQARIVRPGWGVVWVALDVGLSQDDPGTAVVALQDVTAWRRAEQELAHRAAHDALTGLANRSTLQDHLDRSLARLARRPGTVAVLFCDLDGFKDLNDTFGHRFGDLVLREVARRITGAVRRSDIVVRTGGDEFVVICEGDDFNEGQQVAERIRAALEAPMHVQGRDTALSVSIGVSQVSGAEADGELLVRQADLAMYRAKELGRNRIEPFAPELEERARNRVAAAEQVRQAIDEGRVAVLMRPIASLSDGHVVGSEALATIDIPNGGAMSPREVLRDSDGRGLLGRLDAMIREAALDWLAANGEDYPVQWVSASVTSRELTWPGFVARIDASLRKRGVAPQRLVLQVEEEAMLDATQPTLETIRRLRELGCRIAIDNVGGGHSSFTSMRDLPIDLVKIDREFVAGLGRTTGDEAIITAIITVGHSLGRAVIADGVDTAEQAEILRHLECDLGSGEQIGPPERVALQG